VHGKLAISQKNGPREQPTKMSQKSTARLRPLCAHLPIPLYPLPSPPFFPHPPPRSAGKKNDNGRETAVNSGENPTGHEALHGGPSCVTRYGIPVDEKGINREACPWNVLSYIIRPVCTSSLVAHARIPPPTVGVCRSPVPVPFARLWVSFSSPCSFGACALKRMLHPRETVEEEETIGMWWWGGWGGVG